MASHKLIRMLSSPTKVANALNWTKNSGGAILSLDIHRHRVGLAIASHPSIQDRATTLDPIALCNKGKVSTQDKLYLADMMQENNVCGIVVSWPLQENSGRMGAACGRVFHTLEDLVDDSSEVVSIIKQKPLCLWDSEHAKDSFHEDQFGRSPAYCITTKKRIHRASEEQYYQDENIVASQVWEDFVQTHWPDIYQQNSDTDDTKLEESMMKNEIMG